MDLIGDIAGIAELVKAFFGVLVFGAKFQFAKKKNRTNLGLYGILGMDMVLLDGKTYIHKVNQLIAIKKCNRHTFSYSSFEKYLSHRMKYFFFAFLSNLYISLNYMQNQIKNYNLLWLSFVIAVIQNGMTPFLMTRPLKNI